MTLEVHTFSSGPLSTNAHVVFFPSTREAWLVDAPFGAVESLQRFATAHNIQLKALILTHSHWDHIGDAAAIADRWKVKVFLHPADWGNGLQPGSDGVPCWMACESIPHLTALEADQELRLGSSRWRVLHTPGHTPGSICLWEPDQHLLLSGDTLFQGTYGRTDLSTGDEQKMHASLARLAQLPPATMVFPGHGPSTTLRDEHWLHDFDPHN